MTPKSIKKDFEIHSKPRLEPGTVVLSLSLVVDLDGKAWWIDPAARSIKAAVIRGPNK